MVVSYAVGSEAVTTTGETVCDVAAAGSGVGLTVVVGVVCGSVVACGLSATVGVTGMSVTGVLVGLALTTIAADSAVDVVLKGALSTSCSVWVSDSMCVTVTATVLVGGKVSVVGIV